MFLIKATVSDWLSFPKTKVCGRDLNDHIRNIYSW